MSLVLKFGTILQHLHLFINKYELLISINLSNDKLSTLNRLYIHEGSRECRPPRRPTLSTLNIKNCGTFQKSNYREI